MTTEPKSVKGEAAPPAPLLEIEPFTWAWVAEQLIAGILQGAGSLMFSRLFGGAQAVDLSQALLAFAEIVRRAVALELQAQDKRKLEASAASLKSLLGMYANNRDAELLRDLLLKANELTEQTRSLGLPTIEAFCLCGSIELLILDERARVMASAAEKKNLRERADALVSEAKTFPPLLIESNASRFRGQPYCSISNASGFPLQGKVTDCYYLVDNTVVQEFWIPGDPISVPMLWIENRRRLRMEADLEHLRSVILPPFEAVIAQWRLVAQAHQ